MLLRLFTALLFAAAFINTANAQDSLNAHLLARWDDPTLPISPYYSIRYSGCWGLEVNNREIAVLGAAQHVLFFDITEPTEPKLIGKFLGTANTGWREFKSYKNRVYGVSDASSEGLMIFDLSQAPDTVLRTYWSSEYFSSAHTITLDTVSGRIYLNGCNAAYNGLMVLDVKQNPDVPVLLSIRALPGGYIHDSYVRGDTVYASSGTEGFYVFDFTNPDADTIPLLGHASTGGYNHNSWLSADGRYAYYTEEIPAGRPIRIVDLLGLGTPDNIEPVGTFLHTFKQPAPGTNWNAIPHNVYIRGNLLFNSQYEDGLLVYDISNPVDPTLVAIYDTHPQNTVYNGYAGNWGNYPWFRSGTIVCGDMQNGLYLLRLDILTDTKQPAANSLTVGVWPNPAADHCTVRLSGVDDARAGWSLRLLQADGRVVRTQHQAAGVVETTLPLHDLPGGLYFLEILTADGKRAVKKLGK